MVYELAFNVVFFMQMISFARCPGLRVFTLAETVPLHIWGEGACREENFDYWVIMPTQCFVKIVDLKRWIG